MRLVAPATAAVNSSPERWGESTTRTPTNPMTTADQRYTRTRSFKMSAASVTVNRGGAERDRIGLHQGKPRHRTEVEEHAGNAQHTPTRLSKRPLGAHDGGEFTAPGIDQHERNDREHRAVKHDLADRVARAERADERLHHRE